MRIVTLLSLFYTEKAVLGIDLMLVHSTGLYHHFGYKYVCEISTDGYSIYTTCAFLHKSLTLRRRAYIEDIDAKNALNNPTLH